jgi:phosphoribosylformylglycinamidine synthase
VRDLIEARAVTACHDIADGGLLVAVAEMALAANIGVDIMNKAGDLPLHAWGFGEDQGRYIVAAGRANTVLEMAQQAGVPAVVIGRTGGIAISLKGERILLDDLRETHEGWLPNYMNVA